MSVVVRVVPDVPTFAVDDGFLYTADPGAGLRIGSVVRVPLSGRTVRGTVVAVGEGDTTGLKAIKSTSPALPLLDEAHLALHRWLAHHYVAPLAALLRSAAPPNLPRSTRAIPEAVRGPGGRRHIVGGEALAAVAPTLKGVPAGRSALVVCPTEVEASGIAERLGGETVVVLPSLSGAEETKAWVRARTTPGVTVVGTPRVAPWPIAALHTAIVVDDGRRGHKARQTPTIHTRTLLGQRSRFEGVALVTTGVVPALETLAAGASVDTPPGRAWGRVEVVDRTEDPPGTGFLSRRAEVAIAGAAKTGARVAVFTHRRGYAPAFRCVSCRAVRRCSACGARATLTAACGRCGEWLRACAECGGDAFEPLGAAAGVVADRLRGFVDRRLVGVGPDHPVAVVTERDLPALGAVDLAVAVDADGLLLGPSYRSAEDGLRLLARLASLVRRSSGARLMVQTATVGHPALEALRRGDAADWAEGELAARARLGYPPTGEVILVEMRGEADDGALAEVAEAGATVLGPMERDEQRRWLVQGTDLNAARIALRRVARRARDRGVEVRIDVDPIDL